MYRLYLLDDLAGVSDELAEKFISVLPKDCSERAVRYHIPDDRKRSAAGYMLLVYALRNDWGIKDFRLHFGEHGKPYLDLPDVYFSMSHCVKG